MKICLAGATGVIGRRVMALLLAEGYEVVPISRRTNVDVLDRTSLRLVFALERPDLLMHQLTDLSQQSSSANAHLRSVGTRNLVDAAQSVGVERMIAQSIAWAYAPGEGPATEDTPLDVAADGPRRTTIDGIIALERAVSEIPQHVILRYGTFYGADTWFARDGKFADQVRRGDIKMSSAVTNFVHVADAAQAAVQAIRWPSGAVNIVDDSPARGTEWLPIYARELGTTAPEQDAAELPALRPVSNGYARSLGWNPSHPSWKQGFF